MSRRAAGVMLAVVAGLCFAFVVGLLVGGSRSDRVGARAALESTGQWIALHNPDGSVMRFEPAGIVETVTPTASSTATATSTPSPSYTASQTAAPTVTASATSSPTATATATLASSTTPNPLTATPTLESTQPAVTPAPTLIHEEGLCYAGVMTTALNVRADHTTASAQVGKLTQSQRVRIDALYVVHPEGATNREEWGRIPDGGWIALWYQGEELARLDDAAPCWELPIQYAEGKPPSTFGLHLIFTASDRVLDLPQLGMLKGTDGTEWIMRAAHTLRPDVLLVWRNLSAEGIGWRDCPAGWGSGNGAAVADAWWHAQYTTWQARGLIGIVDYFEVVNECGYGGEAWETAFWLRILDDARLAGVCVAAFSDSYGTPEIAQFAARRPILEAMLDQDCAPGRHPAVALHIYEGVDGGVWKFGRWRLFLMLAGLKFEALPWLVTEYGYANGTGSADCGAFWTDWERAEQEFAAHPEIWAAANYSVGGGTGWTDLTMCLESFWTRIGAIV